MLKDTCVFGGKLTIILDIFGVFAGRVHFVQRTGALRIFRIEGHDQGVPVHHVREFPDYETLLRVPDPHLLVLHPEFYSEIQETHGRTVETIRSSQSSLTLISGIRTREKAALRAWGTRSV